MIGLFRDWRKRKELEEVFCGRGMRYMKIGWVRYLFYRSFSFFFCVMDVMLVVYRCYVVCMF